MTNAASRRIVLDTNTLISAAIKPHSTTWRALQKANDTCIVFVSAETVAELVTVLRRPKFDAYFVDMAFSRDLFLQRFLERSTEIGVTENVHDCADPNDNKFLSLALAANAEMLVTGDKKHLLSMNPYRGVHILTATEFLVDR